MPDSQYKLYKKVTQNNPYKGQSLIIGKNKRDFFIKYFTSYSSFFKHGDSIIFIEYDDKIIIQKPGLDYCGRDHKVRKNGNSHNFNAECSWDIGEYFFDDEETYEDMIVIYKNQSLWL